VGEVGREAGEQGVGADKARHLFGSRGLCSSTPVFGGFTTAVARETEAGQNTDMKLALEIPDIQAQQLHEAAERLGVPVETLAQAALSDLAGQCAADFETAATRVLEKNKELYRRLA